MKNRHKWFHILKQYNGDIGITIQFYPVLTVEIFFYRWYLSTGIEVRKAETKNTKQKLKTLRAMKTALEILFDSIQSSNEFKGMETFEQFKELSEGEDKEAVEVTIRAMRAYGEMLLREASEKARLKYVTDGIIKDWHYTIDKQSILSLIDEMK